MDDKNYIIAILICLNVILSLFTIRFFQQSKILELYREESILLNKKTNVLSAEIDSLENIINILSTDTIQLSDWKFYGDTIQYLGEDSILMVYPVEYYRLVVTTNQRTKNQIWSIESKFYNDTITKTID